MAWGVKGLPTLNIPFSKPFMGAWSCGAAVDRLPVVAFFVVAFDFFFFSFCLTCVHSNSALFFRIPRFSQSSKLGVGGRLGGAGLGAEMMHCLWQLGGLIVGWGWDGWVGLGAGGMGEEVDFMGFPPLLKILVACTLYDVVSSKAIASES